MEDTKGCLLVETSVSDNHVHHSAVALNAL